MSRKYTDQPITVATGDHGLLIFTIGDVEAKCPAVLFQDLVSGAGDDPSVLLYNIAVYLNLQGADPSQCGDPSYILSQLGGKGVKA
jgi:hypothetical protein